MLVEKSDSGMIVEGFTGPSEAGINASVPREEC